MANSAGTVGGGNDGQTDKSRGTKMMFSFTKSGRKTGRVSAGQSSQSNMQTVDGNARKASDPRLAG